MEKDASFYPISLQGFIRLVRTDSRYSETRRKETIERIESGEFTPAQYFRLND